MADDLQKMINVKATGATSILCIVMAAPSDKCILIDWPNVLLSTGDTQILMEVTGKRLACQRDDLILEPSVENHAL